MIINEKSNPKKRQIVKDLTDSQKPLDAMVAFRLSSEDLHKVKLLANQTNTNISKVMKSLIKNI